MGGGVGDRSGVSLDGPRKGLRDETFGVSGT